MPPSPTPNAVTRCPCGAKLKVPKSAEGKKAKCPKCHEVFRVSFEDEHFPPIALAPEPSNDDRLLHELADLERSAQTITPKQGAGENGCPKCRKHLADEAVLCIHCGYNLNTGRVVTGARTQKSSAPGFPTSISGATSFTKGLLFSAVGAAIGATIWLIVVVQTGYVIGWIAVGLGALAGYGMLRGYGRPDPRAGVLAVVIAAAGIMSAKIATFSYFSNATIQTAKKFASGRDKAFNERLAKVATHRAERWMTSKHVFDDGVILATLMEQEFDKTAQSSPEEIDREARKVDDWNSGGKWSDEQFVRDLLVCGFASADILAEKENAALLSDRQKAQRWKDCCAAAITRVDAMTNTERIAAAQQLEKARERADQIQSIASHRADLRYGKLRADGVDADFDAISEEEHALVSQWSEEAFSSAIDHVRQWEGGGKWLDETYVRTALVSARLNKELRNLVANDKVSLEQDENLIGRIVAEQSAKVDAMSHPERVKELRNLQEEVVDEGPTPEERRATDAEIDAIARKAFWQTSFGLWDVVFVSLAIGSAWQIATKEREGTQNS